MDGVTGPLIAPPRRAAPGPSLVRWHPLPAPRARLFCFPHAGGGAVAYRTWARLLAPGGVEVIAVRLPGRETRFAETPLTRVEDIVPPLMRELAPWLDRPHAWFGHSLGAVLAFEACRAVRARSLGEPVRLVVSGRPAPHLPLHLPPVHDAPLGEFLARLRATGGTQAELLAAPAALSALLPMLRADFAAGETYRCRPAPPLDCPISVYGGSGDPYAGAGDLRAWERYTAADCAVRIFDGGHFYLHDHPEPVIAALASDLALALHWPRRRIGEPS
ncbi:thioesterase II family protein [Streptomyces coeruleorubidus]|uniref:thioesterase II family protein n=1 Tax=Streptomyces coeruleorubidus TaxID=116188 RepID=UPI0037A9804E